VERQRDGQDVFVQLSDEITYILRVGKDREMVRMCLCGYPMKLHTNCGWAKVEMVGVCLCSYLTKSRTNCGWAKAEGW
jgi:hypothetical protein